MGFILLADYGLSPKLTASLIPYYEKLSAHLPRRSLSEVGSSPHIVKYFLNVIILL